jgi:putative endonuclease
MQHWHLYLVRTAEDTLYAGIATDVERRLEDHRRGGTKAAKYLRSRGPLELAYRVQVGSRGLALRAEARLKKLPKSEKEEIVATAPDRERLLEILAVDTADV